jgi:hypothetical protein
MVAYVVLLVLLALAVPVVLYVTMPGSPLAKAGVEIFAYALTGGLFVRKRQQRRLTRPRPTGPG